MGAEIIQAKYEELDTIAARFKNRAEANAELCSHIERCFQALERDWEGKGANAFCAEMKGELFPAMRRLTDALEQAEAVTLEVKNIIQQAEEEAANLFSTNGRTAPSSQSGSEEGAFSKVLGFMGDLFVGAGSELVDMVKGIGNLIIHPVDTLKGLAYGITHPGELWDAFKKPYVDDWNNGHPGRSIGRGLMFVGSLLVGTKGADKAAKALGITGRGAEAAGAAGKAGRLGETAGAVGTAGRVGESGEVASAVSRAGRVGEEIAEEVAESTARGVAHSVDDMAESILRESASTAANRSELVTELAENGIKHNRNAIVAITRDANNRIVFLETGKVGEKASGLKHILKDHVDDFARQGIQAHEIPDYLMKAVEENKIVGYQGRGISRPIYEVFYNGQKRRVAITIGENGYIVGANPSSLP